MVVCLSLDGEPEGDIREFGNTYMDGYRCDFPLLVGYIDRHIEQYDRHGQPDIRHLQAAKLFPSSRQSMSILDMLHFNNASIQMSRASFVTLMIKSCMTCACVAAIARLDRRALLGDPEAFVPVLRSLIVVTL